jgi:hypothetical protein
MSIQISARSSLYRTGTVWQLSTFDIPENRPPLLYKMCQGAKPHNSARRTQNRMNIELVSSKLFVSVRYAKNILGEGTIV